MRHFIALALAGGLLAVGVTPATAGTYTVLSCRDRAGARAVINDASGGWMPGSTGGPGLDSWDYCDSPSRGFFATVSGIWAHPVGSMAWWRFVPPSGTLVEGADILYSGYDAAVRRAEPGIVYLDGAQSWVPGHELRRGVHSGAVGDLARPARRVDQATAQCDGASGSADCPAGISPRDDRDPAFRDPPDRHIAPQRRRRQRQRSHLPTWQGTMTFAFPATDDGGGVYQAVLEVDGQPGAGADDRRLGRSLRGQHARPTGVPLSTAVPDVGRCR